MSGPGDVSHCNISAQLCQGGGAEGSHALRSAGQSSYRCWIWTLQQPHGLQHQPTQYGQIPSRFAVCSWWSAAIVFFNDGSGLIVFMTTLIGGHYTCSTSRPLISVPLFLLICVCMSCGPGDPQKSVQDQLPLIIGSASAGLVVIVALVVIAVVCLK